MTPADAARVKLLCAIITDAVARATLFAQQLPNEDVQAYCKNQAAYARQLLTTALLILDP
jgi:hypothetical protein